MAGGYRELEDITADVGIEAWGDGIEEAFASAANGLASLIADLPPGEEPLTRDIRIEAQTLPSLLVRFLNEIIYLEETEGFLPHSVRAIGIDGTRLAATLTGTTFDPAVHTMNTSVKAATYHGLEIHRSGRTVRIQVIFDV